MDLWPTVSLISWIGMPLLLMIDTAVCRPSWACHSAGNLREMAAMKWFAYVCACFLHMRRTPAEAELQRADV